MCFWNNIQTMLLEQESQEGIEGGEVGEVNRTQITVSDRAGPWVGCSWGGGWRPCHVHWATAQVLFINLSLPGIRSPQNVCRGHIWGCFLGASAISQKKETYFPSPPN